MAFFIPFYFQKRILRYVLSRIEILDTDALDLEKLEIVWGKTSTIELKDVGIRIEKLTSLLQLPEPLLVTEASLSTLKLTVPADLYRTGIRVEVSDVDVQLELRIDHEKKDEPSLARKASADEDSPTGRRQPVPTRRSESTVHDPGNRRRDRYDGPDIGTEDGSDPNIPSTTDLAQSFLEAEPVENRRELQAAIAQSQSLKRPDILEKDKLETSNVGVGTPFSLPSFLAGFLEGVADRSVFTGSNICLEIKMPLKMDQSGTPKGRSVKNVEEVRIRLEVGRFTFGEVLRQSPSLKHEKPYVHETSTRNGMRPVSFENIKVLCLANAFVFSDLASSPLAYSPRNVHSSASWPARRTELQQSSPATQSVDFHEDLTTSVSDLGSLSDDYRMRNPTESSRSATRPTSQHDPKPASESDHLADPWDRDYLQDSYSEYEDSLHPAPDDHAKSPSPPTGKPSTSHGLPDATLRRQDDSDSPEIPRRHQNRSGRASGRPSAAPSGLSLHVESNNATPESERSGSPSGDLAQSQLFSHEDATSMYMSAMSEKTGQNQGSPKLPGAWNFSDPDRSTAVESDIFQSTISHQHGPPQSISHSPDHEIHTSAHSAISSAEDVSKRPEASPSSTSSARTQCQPSPNTASHSLPRADSSSQSDPLGSQSPFQYDSQAVLCKVIAEIDNIKVQIPRKRDSVQSSDTGSAEGVGTGVASKNADADSGTSSRARRQSVLDGGSAQSQRTLEEESDGATVVAFGCIQIFADLMLTKFSILTMEQLLPLFPHATAQETGRAPAAKAVDAQNVKLELAGLTWTFLREVKGYQVANSTSQQSEPYGLAQAPRDDVLLEVVVQGIEASYQRTAVSTTIKASLDKFSLGYSDEDILSFDSGLKMRDSTRDILSPVNKDLMLSATMAMEQNHFDITTLPLHLTLDLRKLDEIFAWFGGFGSMLGLGSSMVSTITTFDRKSHNEATRESRKGVRFEDAELRDVSAENPRSPVQKVTARIGGLVFDICGSTCSVGIETSAVKIVSRMEGVGLQVDRISVKGPPSVGAHTENLVLAQISNTRVEYLPIPKEPDLSRLLALLSPSEDGYERDDDILLDTLLRQRRKGGVVRATTDGIDLNIPDLQVLDVLQDLGNELTKLSSVAKYLPEDDRPGLLTLGLIRSLKGRVGLNRKFGNCHIDCQSFEFAYITFPSLISLGINSLKLFRDDGETILGMVNLPYDGDTSSLPAIMARFIGNEMEPKVTIKLHRLQFEYSANLLSDIMSMEDPVSTERFVSDMASSIATLTMRKMHPDPPIKPHSQHLSRSDDSSVPSKALGFEIHLKDVIIGLNPLNSKAKGLLVLTLAHINSKQPGKDQTTLSVDIKKASVMLIDDPKITPDSEKGEKLRSRSQTDMLEAISYVVVCRLSAAHIAVQAHKESASSDSFVDVQLRNDLLVLETCADSTQTLIQVLSGLNPPMPKSVIPKYRTEVVPIQDMLASFSGAAFPSTQDPHHAVVADKKLETVGEEAMDSDDGDMVDDDVPQNLEFVSSFYNPDLEATSVGIADSILEEDDLDSLVASSLQREIGGKNMLESFEDQTRIDPENLPLSFEDDHFGSSSDDTQDASMSGPRPRAPQKKRQPPSPLRIQIQDMHIIWNLFDGYDWQRTRDTISQAVDEVQQKAAERSSRKEKRRTSDTEYEKEDVIGDFLFNSIYIGIPAQSDPLELTRQINHEIGDPYSDTESNLTSTSSRSPIRPTQPTKQRHRSLHLTRSKHHKMTFELKGVSAQFVVTPPGREDQLENVLDLRVHDLEIFDHVPTSTWKKFATYMRDAGEREMGSSMIHIEIQTVKPVPTLSATEVLMKVRHCIVDATSSC